MAFNPFRRFRKHQKVFFAVMTIVCMITFVFSGSVPPAPIPSRTPCAGSAWPANGRRVLPLYGKKIYTDDLDKLRMHRQLANEFLELWHWKSFRPFFRSEHIPEPTLKRSSAAIPASGRRRTASIPCANRWERCRWASS